jgi:DNA-binding NarL/FixJ family response regulator
MIRLAIVADSPVMRAGLGALFGAESDIVVSFPDVSARVDGSGGVGDRLDEASIDVMLRVLPYDRGGMLPHGDDDDLDAREVRVPTIALLERMEQESARQALAAGASGVLALDADADELIAAVRAAAAGLVVMQPSVVAGLAGALSSPAVRQPARALLSAREREVLALLAEGLPNKVIAPRLGITEHTVKTHVAAVYEKLHARNRAEAVMAAARQGLLLL